MSYLDGSEEDDRARDERAGRSRPPTRPAWDAGTYGRTDDTRWVQPPPSRGRGGGAQPAEPAPEPYPEYAPDYEPEPYPTTRYSPDAYPGAAGYAPDPYPSSYAPEAPVSYAAAEPIPQPYAVDTLPEYPAAEPEDEVAEPDRGRSGRNLPAAIGVGLTLGAAVIASLFLWRPAFLGVIIAAIGLGVWELVRAIRTSGANPPLIPLIAGGVLMTGLAWWGEADALVFGLIVTVLAAMVWRLADGAPGYGGDVTAATLIAVYLPYLGGFAALLAGPSDGHLRVLVTLAGVVLSDTGGYISGVMFGRHPMAPSVSPKKSWEGLAGSLVAAAVGGALLLFFLFHVALWRGAVFGVAVALAAVLGDLGESLLKRDLGVKDMSRLLPGHGGVMDRLDSIVLALPTAYVLLLALAPPAA